MVSPGQPAFLTELAGGDVSNVTGDGTIYTVLWGVETFDQGANVSGSTFTAPVAGRYLFSTMLSLQQAASGHTSGVLRINAGGVTFRKDFNPYNERNTGDDVGATTLTVLCDMAADDTALVTVQVSGGAKAVDIIGATYSFFSGFLAA